MVIVIFSCLTLKKGGDVATKVINVTFFFLTLGAKNGSRNVTFILSQIDLIRSTYLKKNIDKIN